MRYVVICYYGDDRSLIRKYFDDEGLAKSFFNTMTRKWKRDRLLSARLNILSEKFFYEPGGLSYNVETIRRWGHC